MARRARKPPRPYTAPRLEAAALYYLERYASSSDNLRRVLENKVRRGLGPQAEEEHIAQAREWIEAIVEKLTRLGYLNDKAYAENLAGREARRGRGTARIRQTLAVKGVGAELASATLAALKDEDAASDLRAAITYAARRKIGPFRTKPLADPLRDGQKELAALARQGIPLAIAQKLLKAATADDAWALLDEET